MMLTYFNQVVLTHGDQPAVQLGEQVLTYRELDARSNQVAHWLISRGLLPNSVVATNLEHPIEWIVALLGILKAGGHFLPLPTTDPVERLKERIREAQASMLLSEVKFLRPINELQWSCASLQTVLCVDSTDFYAPLEPAHGTMGKELWEYIGSTGQDAIERGGWVNSYTRAPFSRAEMDEYTQNVLTKLQPYLRSGKRVLEVGCASGLTLYAIAPFVKEYYGTDLSQAAIDYNRQVCAAKGFHHIQLACVDAANVLSIETRGFDVIIINSVIQYFPGFNALRHFVGDAIELLCDDGVLFVGDIMDLDQKDALQDSLHRYKQAHPAAATKLDLSEELFVPRSFFDDLAVEFPAIRRVQHSDKWFTISNELTQFRYDALLQLDKTGTGARTTRLKHKYQFDARAIQACPMGPVVRPAIAEDREPAEAVLSASELSAVHSSFTIFGSLLDGVTLQFIARDPAVPAAPAPPPPHSALDGKGEVEERLMATWKAILIQETVCWTDNFFDIGGTSLKAIHLINEINGAFGSTYTILDLFMYPNIQAFSAMMQDAGDQPALPSPPLPGAVNQVDHVLQLLNRPNNG